MSRKHGFAGRSHHGDRFPSLEYEHNAPPFQEVTHMKEFLPQIRCSVSALLSYSLMGSQQSFCPKEHSGLAFKDSGKATLKDFSSICSFCGLSQYILAGTSACREGETDVRRGFHLVELDTIRDYSVNGTSCPAVQEPCSSRLGVWGKSAFWSTEGAF